MIKIVAIFFLLAAALSPVMTEEQCNEENLKDCLSSLEESVMNNLHDYKNADKTSYCQSLVKGGKCVKEASESCKGKYPKMSKLIISFYAYLNQVCTETYNDIAACIQEHESEFEKCKFNDDDDDHPADPIAEICGEVEVLKCAAMVSRKVCENGEAFAKAMEQHVKELQSEVCNSAGFVGYSYWILTAMLFILFSTRNKF